MVLGIGYFYDRRHYRYHRITEHATDAVTFPSRFRSQEVAHLNPTRDRDVIVRHVAAQGFIRVRLWKSNLGWEFHADPDDALAVLRRFIRRHELGPLVQINISDFASGISVVVPALAALAAKSSADLGLIAKRRRSQ